MGFDPIHLVNKLRGPFLVALGVLHDSRYRLLSHLCLKGNIAHQTYAFFRTSFTASVMLLILLRTLARFCVAFPYEGTCREGHSIHLNRNGRTQAKNQTPHAYKKYIRKS